MPFFTVALSPWPLKMQSQNYCYVAGCSQLQLQRGNLMTEVPPFVLGNCLRLLLKPVSSWVNDLCRPFECGYFLPGRVDHAYAGLFRSFFFLPSRPGFSKLTVIRLPSWSRSCMGMRKLSSSWAPIAWWCWVLPLAANPWCIMFVSGSKADCLLFLFFFACSLMAMMDCVICFHTKQAAYGFQSSTGARLGEVNQLLTLDR